MRFDVFIQLEVSEVKVTDLVAYRPLELVKSIIFDPAWQLNGSYATRRSSSNKSLKLTEIMKPPKHLHQEKVAKVSGSLMRYV